jgi:hypothetical protein
MEIFILCFHCQLWAVSESQRLLSVQLRSCTYMLATLVSTRMLLKATVTIQNVQETTPILACPRCSRFVSQHSTGGIVQQHLQQRLMACQLASSNPHTLHYTTLCPDCCLGQRHNIGLLKACQNCKSNCSRRRSHTAWSELHRCQL